MRSSNVTQCESIAAASESRLLRVQRDLAIALNHCTTLDEVLRQVLLAASRVYGIDSGGTYLIDESTGELHLAAYHNLSAGFVELVGRYAPDSPQAQVVFRGEPTYAAFDQLPPAIAQQVGSDGIRFLAIIPVQCDGQVVAAMNLASHAVDDLSDAACNALEGMVALVGPAVVRMRAAAAVRSGRENLRTLFHSVHDLLLVVDAQGCLLDVNRAVCQRLGYAPDELIGQPVVNLHPACRRDEARKILEEIVAGQRSVCTVPLEPRGSGSLIEVEISVARGQWNGKDVLFGVARDVTERKRAERQLRREDELLRRTLELHERERGLLAYEIHDGFTQNLAAVLLNLQSAEVFCHAQPDARRVLASSIDLLRLTLQDARKLISSLRPPVLDEAGIIMALDYLAAEFQSRTGLEVEFVSKVSFERLAAPLETAIFRVANEALTNVVRHSQCRRARLTIRERDDRVRVSIRDWGVGFQVRQVAERQFGLLGIRQRARLLGGKARIRSQIGVGTEVAVELPCMPPL